MKVGARVVAPGQVKVAMTGTMGYLDAANLPYTVSIRYNFDIQIKEHTLTRNLDECQLMLFLSNDKIISEIVQNWLGDI